MEQVPDDLISVLQAQANWDWRLMALIWALHLAGNLMTGIATELGVAIGPAFAA